MSLATEMEPIRQACHDGTLSIAHVTAYYMPGLGYQENHLPFRQAALGHDVHIVTGDRPVPDPRFAAQHDPAASERYRPGTYREDGATLHRLPVAFEIIARNNLCLRNLATTLDKIRPDVVHVHGITLFTTLEILLASLSSRPAIVVDHHLCRFNLHPWSWPKRVWYGVWRYAVLPPLRGRVAAWLPINDDARGVLASALGISGSSVRVNRLGADIEHFRWNPVLRSETRARHGIDAKSRTFAHAGRMGPRKDIDVLLRAFAEHCLPSDTLIIAGNSDAAFADGLRELAARASGKVLFLPMQSAGDLAALFSAADVAVWPGDGAVTLIQAMACGLPALMADNPGTDYVASCPDAATFPRGDHHALGRLMASAAGPDTPNASEMRARISAFCRRHFDWQGIAVESIEIYRDAIRKVSAR